jgi:glycosyltransferase involved in cell wall biosynthesis
LIVLISYNENFANVVIESLSVGTPVLLSNEVGLADYVEEKKLGWITDLTPKNITEQLIKSFEAKNSRAVIRETAPQIIIEDFDSKNLIKKYFKLYSQIK